MENKIEFDAVVIDGGNAALCIAIASQKTK